MEKRHWIFSIILAIIVGYITFNFNLDYYNIAEIGTTLTSIVLAVYMSAIIGLINTDLAKQMALQVAPKQKINRN